MRFLLFFLAFLTSAFSREAMVVSGEVEFIESDEALLVVQRSPTAMIEWDEFSIDSGKTIEFSLPTEEASITHCTVAESSSQIDGTLKSNGCICLTHLNGSLKNNGHIEATQVELNAAGEKAQSFAIIQNGIIQAKEKVILHAGEGSIEISGVVTVAESKKGGGVEVLGKSIFLRKGSELDVSGDWGGGKILVGIDEQGEHQASFLLMEEGATARADARMDGNGGTIKFFAEKENLFLGLASVQGGCINGDGGLVEITSLGTMRDLGRVLTLAPFGKAGTVIMQNAERETQN